MNSDIYMAIWNSLVTFVFPFFAFVGGVYISDVLGLNSKHPRKHVYFMALPVGLLTVGMLLSATKVNAFDKDGIPFTDYGHTQDVAVYMVFVGTIMFYGTLVPEFFGKLQNAIGKGQ